MTGAEVLLEGNGRKGKFPSVHSSTAFRRFLLLNGICTRAYVKREIEFPYANDAERTANMCRYQEAFNRKKGSWEADAQPAPGIVEHAKKNGKTETVH